MSARVAISVAGAAVGLGASFAPVPWVAPVAGIVFSIITLCQNAEANRRAIKQLGCRCESYIIALNDAAKTSTSEAMEDAINASIQTLIHIKQNLLKWHNMSKMTAFVRQMDTSEEIRQCHQALDSLCANFFITSHIALHHWQDDFAKNFEQDFQEISRQLADIKKSQDIITEAVQSNTQTVIDFMRVMQEQMMPKFEIGDYRHTGLQSNLYDVSQRTGQLLPNIDLKAGEVRRVGNNPVGGGPAFDIWEGEYLGREKVAIKIIRGVEVHSSERALPRFIREIGIWRTVWDDPEGKKYILPFYGVCHTDGPYPYMVSPWMRNGDALRYVRTKPNADRRKIVRRIAEGIRLLHSQNPPVVHGDLKAANILIDDFGNPRLADFGLSKILEDLTGTPFTQSRGISDSYRWFAPELCTSPGTLTTASDIFSFAMTTLEIMTGEQPFATIKRTPEVLIRMQSGDRPTRPTRPDVIANGLDDDLWNLLQRCWDKDVSARPSIHEVLALLPPA